MASTAAARHEDVIARNFRSMPTTQAWKSFTDYCQTATPSPGLYSTALDTLSRIGQFHRAISLWNEMKAKGVESPLNAHNTMLGVYGKAGEDEKVINLFNEMARGKAFLIPDASSYGHVIEAYARLHQPEKALTRFQEMKTQGLEPSDRILELVEKLKQGQTPPTTIPRRSITCSI